MLLVISRQIYMSKHLFLLIALLFFGVACKTNQGLSKEFNPNAELSRDKGEAEIQELVDVPMDIASLHKALGLSEAEKGKFFEIYKKHHSRIQEVKKLELGQKEESARKAKIKRERDREIYEMLDSDQSKIYTDYIKSRKKREIESGNSKSKNF